MRKIKWLIPKKQLVDGFISNIHTNINYNLVVLCLSNFEETIEKGILIARRVIKLYNPKDQPSTSEDKPKIWVKNNNITNNGVVDAKVVHNVQTLNMPKNQVQTTHQGYQ